MEHNDKFSKRQKLRQILALHNQKGNNTHPSTNDSKICIASIPLKRKVTGIPQILATFWRVCVKLSRSVSFSRPYAHYLPKSVAYSEVTTLIGLPAKKLQTPMAVPANHHKRVRSCRQQRWPFATSLQIALLVKSLNQGELTMRAEAARRLGELGECAPVEPLLEALDDEQRFVRAEAARALGKLGERVPIAPLVTALHDRDGSVRVAAAQALGMLGKRESLQVIDSHVRHNCPSNPGYSALSLPQDQACRARAGSTGRPPAECSAP